MVKSLVSLLVALALLIGGAFLEQHCIKKDFDRFSKILTQLYDKIEEEEATKEDVLSVQKWWVNKKKHLHTYIPHNDIREMDYWIAEAVCLVKTKKYDEALAKIEVVLEICEHIPSIYSTKLQNIF